MHTTAHRTVRPLLGLMQPPTLAPRRRPAAQQQRAQLVGLEVAESSFGEWLAAGGDRRSTTRTNGTHVLAQRK